MRPFMRKLLIRLRSADGTRRWSDVVFTLVAIPLLVGMLAFVAVHLIRGTVRPATPLLTARLEHFDALHGDLQRRVARERDPIQAGAVASEVVTCVHAHLAGMPGLTEHQLEGMCVQDQLDQLEATHLDGEPVAQRHQLLARLGFALPPSERD